MRKKLFNPLIVPEQIPGYESRFMSLDSFLGGKAPESKESSHGMSVLEEKNLRAKFKSNQVSELLPSHNLRKKGLL